MATLGDDCYFFCTSSCAKGPACQFRHVEAAKTCKIICQHWQMGGCFRPMCKFRHSDFKLPLALGNSDVPCYWESQPTGCTRINCVFKHTKPRPVDDLTTSAVTSGAGDSPAVSVSSGGSETAATSQNMVRPLVKPVIIQTTGESEDSNTSPVKRPPDMSNTQTTTGGSQSDIKTLTEDKKPEPGKTDYKENTNKEDEKQNEETKTLDTPPPKIVPKKKKVKAGVKKSKPAQSANGKKVVKKVPGSATKKVVKVKAKAGSTKKTPAQPRKPIKERLGVVPARRPAPPTSRKSESDSGEDSSDSIENVKVKSMEEIFRQKALESMMKKRAAEGKPVPKVKQPVKKTTVPVKKIQPITAPSETSSSSEDSSDEDDDEEEDSKQSSDSSSSSSSSDSSSSSSSEDDSEDSEQFEPDVRRVVVDVDSEKAARKRAKASLMKKQKTGPASALNRLKGGKVTKATARLVNQSLEKKNKALKKRMVNVDYDSDDIVSARVKKPLTLNVRDRLGMPTPLGRTASAAGPLSRLGKFGMGGDAPKRVTVVERDGDSPRKTVLRKSNSSGSEDDRDTLAEVKVKTLEEIKQEKMRKLAAQQKETGSPQSSPVRQRLGMSTVVRHEQEDEKKGRQILLVSDAGSKSDDASNAKTSEEQKKAKRRPWRSQKRNVEAGTGDEGGDDERTAVMTSLTASDIKQTAAGDDYESELNRYKEERNIDESPFEQMRRRALMKKLQMQKSKKLAKSASFGNEAADSNEDRPASPRRNIIQDLKSVAELEAEAKTAEKEQNAVDSSDSKKHKHKHKHKHHKKVKTERQIYMPPAMKNSAAVAKPASVSPEKSLPARESITAPTAKVAPQKRGPHPIAAAWAAGLSLSAKGAPVRRPEAVEKVVIAERPSVAERLGGKDSVAEPKAKITFSQGSEPSSETGEVKIKTFSEIMAEKRKRRLEMQAQKAGNTATSTSTPSLSASSSSLSSSTRPTAFPSASATSLPSASSTSLPSSSIQPISSPGKMAAESKPRVPISPIVFSTDSPASITQRANGQSNLFSTQTTVQNARAASSIQTASAVNPLSSASSPIKQSIPKSAEKLPVQKVKLKSGKKNVANTGDKKKKGKKLFKKKKQSDLSGAIHSEDSNMSSSSFQSQSLTSIPSVSAVPLTTSDTSQDASSSQTWTSVAAQPSNISNISNDLSASIEVDSLDNSLDNNFSTVSDRSSVTSVATSQPASIFSGITETKPSSQEPGKQKSSTLNVNSEPTKKKARLSMDDEFSFFEDESLVEAADEGVDDIDDLLHDIDDLLS